MNKVIMMGRICNELELKTTPSGTNVCSFRIAVDRNYQVKGEEKKTDFFNVVAWRAAAEFVTRQNDPDRGRNADATVHRQERKPRDMVRDNRGQASFYGREKQ